MSTAMKIRRQWSRRDTQFSYLVAKQYAPTDTQIVKGFVLFAQVINEIINGKVINWICTEPVESIRKHSEK